MAEQASDNRERRWRLLGRACLALAAAVTLLVAQWKIEANRGLSTRLTQGFFLNGDPRDWEIATSWMRHGRSAQFYGVGENYTLASGINWAAAKRPLPEGTWRMRWKAPEGETFAQLDLMPLANGTLFGAALGRSRMLTVRMTQPGELESRFVDLPELAATSTTLTLLPAAEPGGAPVAVYFAEDLQRLVAIESDTGRKSWEHQFRVPPPDLPHWVEGLTGRVTYLGRSIGWATRKSAPGFVVFDAAGNHLLGNDSETLEQVVRAVNNAKYEGLIFVCWSRWLLVGPDAYLDGLAQSPPRLSARVVPPPFFLPRPYSVAPASVFAFNSSGALALSESIMNSTYAGDEVPVRPGSFPMVPPLFATTLAHHLLRGGVLSHEPVIGFPGDDLVMIRTRRMLRFQEGAYSPKDTAPFQDHYAAALRGDTPTSATVGLWEELRRADPEWIANSRNRHRRTEELPLPYWIRAGRAIQVEDGYWLLVIETSGAFAEAFYFPRAEIFAGWGGS